MKWFFTKILAGIGLAIGFLSIMAVYYFVYKYYIDATKENISQHQKTSTQNELGPIVDVPESYENEKTDMLFKKGKKYQRGDGVEKNINEAVKWYTKAAESGSDKAQIKLGYLYRDGDEIEKNSEKSFYWFKKSMEQGNIDAFNNVAYAYLTGDPVEVDNEKAYNLYLHAANNGDSYATGQIGYMYLHGFHVERSTILAQEWYLKGAKLGDEASIEIVNERWPYSFKHKKAD